MVLGRELLNYGTLRESYIILIGRQNAARMLLRGLLDEAEEARLHFFSIDDEGSSKDLVAAVFRVDLGKSEDLRVG